MDIKNNRKNSLVVQGSILAAAFMIVKLIGFFYRIPLANLLGDEGSGYYSWAFQIYTFFLMVSTYGFPVAIAKLTAEKYSENKYKEAQVIFKAAMSLAFFIGLIFSAVLWFGAQPLAFYSGFPKSVYSIKALVPALFCFSLLAVLRGYFQGMNTMVPTAISQVIEQIFNVTFSLILAAVLVHKGVEYGAAGSTIGTGIGALSALLFLAFIYRAARRKIIRKNLSFDHHTYQKKSIFHYWKIILWLAFPIMLSSIIINFMGILDSFMIQKSYIFSGHTPKEAAQFFGLYAMKNQLLLGLAITVAAALSTASIPGLAASVIKGDKLAVQHKITTALRVTLLTGIPATVGIFVLAGPILTMLFGGPHIEMATLLLQFTSLTIVFYGISTVCIGLIQGLGRLKQQIIIALICLVVKVVTNALFMFVFDFQLYGMILSNTIYGLLNAYLSIRVVSSYMPIKLNLQKAFVLPTIASLLMGIICYIMYNVIGGISGSNTLATIMAILISLLVFGITLLKLKGISEEEIRSFPKGHIIMRYLRRFGLI